MFFFLKFHLAQGIRKNSIKKKIDGSLFSFWSIVYILSVLEEESKNNETEITVSLKIEITESFEKLKRKNGSD